MSFLDNLKKRAAENKSNEAAVSAEAPAEKKVNPLTALKKKNAASAGESRGASLLERMKAKKATEAASEAKTDNLAKEIAEAPVKVEKEPSLQEKAEAVVKARLEVKIEDEESDTSVEDTTEPKAEAEAKPVEENSADKNEAAEEEVQTAEAEEKPKKRRRRRSKKTEAEEPTEPEQAEEKPESKEIHVHEYVNNYDILGKKVSYDEMAGAVMDYFVDDEWKNTQDELNKKLSDIRIEPDMNPGTLKYALADLNNLNDEIALVYIEQKQLLDTLTDKEFGAATALMAMNQKGANAEERKANGFMALTHADFGDAKNVNLIALINAVKARFVFLNSLTKRIQYKSNLCITMSSAIKMENSMSMMGAQG
jgi:hypothetical protein